MAIANQSAKHDHTMLSALILKQNRNEIKMDKSIDLKHRQITKITVWHWGKKEINQIEQYPVLQALN